MVLGLPTEPQFIHHNDNGAGKRGVQTNPRILFPANKSSKKFWKTTGSDSDSQPTERHNNTIITPTILMLHNIVRLELRLEICFNCYNATLLTEPQMLNWIIFCSNYFSFFANAQNQGTRRKNLLANMLIPVPKTFIAWSSRTRMIRMKRTKRPLRTILER